MILARVITGEYCLGKKSYKCAPRTTDENGNELKADSVVDSIENPQVFCVFEDAAAYPEYVIKYWIT